MRRGAHPAGSGRHADPREAQLADDLDGVGSRLAESHNSRPGFWPSLAHNLVTFVTDPLGNTVAEILDNRGDFSQPDFQ